MNIFLLLVSLLPYFVSSATAAAAAASAPLLSSNKNANAKAGGVYELTSVTLDKNIRDGSLWLVEFYAPWCRHCSTFAPTYDQLAHSIHSGNSGRERPIKLAKVNGDKERASTSRFNIQGYPMFFVVDGWKVYQYDGARSEDALKTFVVRDGYKAQNVSTLIFQLSAEIKDDDDDGKVYTCLFCSPVWIKTLTHNFLFHFHIILYYTTSHSPFGHLPWAHWVKFKQWCFGLEICSLPFIITLPKIKDSHRPMRPFSLPLEVCLRDSSPWSSWQSC